MSTGVILVFERDFTRLFLEAAFFPWTCANEEPGFVPWIYFLLKSQQIRGSQKNLDRLLGPLLNPVHALVHDVASHRVLDTLNHIISRMPEASVLKDENPACLGQGIISPHHVM